MEGRSAALRGKREEDPLSCDNGSSRHHEKMMANFGYFFSGE